MKWYFRLWLLAQLTVLGTYDKRRLVLKHYRGQRRILEIGCSVGNVSMAFRQFPNISFVGLDIDSDAISVAQSIFRSDPRFRFIGGTAHSLIGQQEPFDLVLLAGVLHHVNDVDATDLISTAAQLLAPAGTLVISEPEPPRATDSWLVRLFGVLERGQWLRKMDDLITLIRLAQPSLVVTNAETYLISPSVFGWPNCARFALINLKPSASTA